MEARLKTGLWVRAVLRRIGSDGTSAMILKKGDEDAGAVLIILTDRMNNIVVLREDGIHWNRTTMADQGALNEYLERQKRYDPDLWVVEFEPRDALYPLEKTLGSRRLRLEEDI